VTRGVRTILDATVVAVFYTTVIAVATLVKSKASERMAKTWSADNPKAALMERKRLLLLNAARRAFLNAGYAEASVNHIAADAGVSIKTLYRHFENKADLFAAVMQAACEESAGAQAVGDAGSAPAWYALAPTKALQKAGEEYLRSILSADQLALYRVAVRDAHRFPELGRLYREQTINSRYLKFVGYLEICSTRENWKIKDRDLVTKVFAGLLKSHLFDEALLGSPSPSEREIVEQARKAAAALLVLLGNGAL